MEFKVDKNVSQIAEAYAMDAIDFASDNFNITLDFSDQSVKHVEMILDQLHQSSLEEAPSDEQILRIAKTLGSYIGEVYRRNHGAEWGMITENKESFPGLRTSKTSNMFWPWGKVKNRLINGCEDNVWDYYWHLIN